MCVVPPDVQGVSWYVSLDEEDVEQEPSPSDPGKGPPPEDQEPLYAVPRKDHQRFTLDNFVLHKMLGKGSFGKVAPRPPIPGRCSHRTLLSTYKLREASHTGAL